MACHHWISVTACAGEAAKASVTAVAAAAPKYRKVIKPLPLTVIPMFCAVSAPDDVHMTPKPALGMVRGKVDARKRENVMSDREMTEPVNHLAIAGMA